MYCPEKTKDSAGHSITPAHIDAYPGRIDAYTRSAQEVDRRTPAWSGRGLGVVAEWSGRGRDGTQLAQLLVHFYLWPVPGASPAPLCYYIILFLFYIFYILFYILILFLFPESDVYRWTHTAGIFSPTPHSAIVISPVCVSPLCLSTEVPMDSNK